MNRVIDDVAAALLQAASNAFGDDATINSLIAESVTVSTQPQFGHYQCNAAMRLAKQLRQKPRDIATALCEHISTPAFAEVAVAGPGFINITLAPEAITAYCQTMLTEPALALPLPEEKQQRVVVDYSSPNIAKEMHVGHLRSTIIGDCLANAYSVMGHDVLRLNHIGDWGTAFGMLICYLQDEQPAVVSERQATDLSELVVWYKLAKARFDADPEFKRRSQRQVVLLQSGDADSLQLWQLICRVSRTGFQAVYDSLGITGLIERGESFYNPHLPAVIKQFETARLLTLSDGAGCVFLPGFKNRDGDPLPLMIQKSDGGYNYSTTDLAALTHRVTQEHADRIVYVTDSGQSLHFEMVFSAARQVGIIPAAVRCDHVGFGLVLGEDGKKFKTRSGDTVRLQSLLDEAVTRAAAIFSQRHPEWSASEVESAAVTLGIAAVKYADLSSNRQHDYVFSFDRMLQFEGNTAAFILYSFVRIASVIRKTGADVALIPLSELQCQHPSEIALAEHLTRFKQVMMKLVDEGMPHLLTDYLYETAQRFNAFFRDCRIEGDPQQSSRLLLCRLTAAIIEQGLAVLGIATLDRM